jgi:hypothetical protein
VLSALEARIGGKGHEALALPTLEAALQMGDGAYSTLATLASKGGDIGVRTRAIFAIAERFVLDAALSELSPRLDEESPAIVGAAAEAIFVAAVRAAALRSEPRLVGRAFEVLVDLVEHADVEPLVKEKALAFLGKEAPPATIGPLLSRVSSSADPYLRNLAARILVKSDGLDADALRMIAEDEARPIADRLGAIERIARELPEELSLPLLERNMPSPSAAIAERAFELYFAAAESGWEPSLERAVAFGEGAQRAALLGALEHGRGAKGALVGIAKSAFLPELRIGAVRILGLRYRWSEIGKTLEALAVDPILAGAVNEALARFDPDRPLLAAPISAPFATPALDAFEAETGPMEPATPTIAPRRSRKPKPIAQTDDLTIPPQSPSADEILDRAPTKPVPPAQLGGRTTAPQPARPRPPSKAPVVEPAPTARAPDPPSKGPEALGPIPLARAQEVLRECVRQGEAGFKGLRLLALSPRVPDEVRAGAARQLAVSFADRDLDEVLVRCLEGGPLVQATALGCLMVKKSVPEAPIARLAEDRSADLASRLRAVRFLPSRYGRAQVAPVLLRLLECGQPEVERAALEGLFSSLRFTTHEAAEAALINLLREHESLEVKTWAAQALGTFGSNKAIAHLEHFTGLFAEPEVKAVARRAVARLRG